MSLVKGVAPEPSAFTTQMLEAKLVLTASLPSRARSDVNMTLLPSGDHMGETELA